MLFSVGCLALVLRTFGVPGRGAERDTARVSVFMRWCLWQTVYADGSICLDILQNQWSPIYDVAAILTSIQVSDRDASRCP